LSSFGGIECLEAFLLTELNKIFSGRQPCQGVEVLHCCRGWLHPHLQVANNHILPLKVDDISHKAFVAAEFNKIVLDRKLCQGMLVLHP
jgi:hypothetical protein